MFYRGVKGVGLVFDLTNQDSFNSLDSWLQEFIDAQGQKDYDCSEVSIILIGNKIDQDKRVVQNKEIL